MQLSRRERICRTLWGKKNNKIYNEAEVIDENAENNEQSVAPRGKV